jgi:methionyl-tRNA formyltransferase
MSIRHIIFAGSGEFGLPTLRALIAANLPIVQVISQPDRPAGRGRELTPTPISQFAASRQLPLLKTANINTESLPDADLMIVIAFGQKISPPVVNRPRLGSVNLHASRLPKCRGAAPINWTILRGEDRAGNSIIRLAEKMDAGAILAQSDLAIGELETAGELHDRLAEDGATLMLNVIQQLQAGILHEIPQNESQATIAPKLSRETALIDWHHPAPQIARQIRGLSPWPGCRVRLLAADGSESDRLTLVRGRPTAISPPTGEPGQIQSNLAVSAGDGGGVEIAEIQPQGKRPMPLSAYRNGHPWEPGMRLESIR